MTHAHMHKQDAVPIEQAPPTVRELHKLIFQAACDMFAKGGEVDPAIFVKRMHPDPNDKVACLPIPAALMSPDGKDILAGFINHLTKIPQILAVAYVAECWTLHRKTPEELRAIYERHESLEHAEGRGEGVLIMINFGGMQWVYTHTIDRAKPEGERVLPATEVMTSIEGRFATDVHVGDDAPTVH